MPRYAVVEKPEGETPLQTLERFRAEHDIADTVPITYAGRLDPMASGKLLLLVGDQCKKKDRYLTLDKEYGFEILFGMESDTGDILGLVKQRDVASIPKATLENTLRELRGRISLPYPVYSSKPVEGRPLFQHAREGSLGTLQIPSKRVEVHDVALSYMIVKKGHVIMNDITSRIRQLQNDPEDPNPFKDFRRDQILAQWQEHIDSRREYSIARIRAVVSSGTYIRSLAPLIAKRAGTFGLAYSIRRTEIGKYFGLMGSGLWLKRY